MGGSEGNMAKVEARLGTDGTVSVRRRRGRWERAKKQADWARVDSTSEAELERQSGADDDEAAATAASWARRVRRRTRLSQTEFAARIGVPVKTVEEWEAGESFPEGPALALLRVIDRLPKEALAALAA
jgi:putative transcriptional regulator